MSQKTNIEWCDSTWNPVLGCSSDLFHESLSDEVIDRAFAVMALAPQHTFQVLTKRPKRMRAYCSQGPVVLNGRINEAARDAARAMRWKHADGLAVLPTQQHGMVPDNWPLPNVWLGVSAEDQARADERIPLLLDTPATVRWVSYEPALGPARFLRWLPCLRCDNTGSEPHGNGGKACGGCWDHAHGSPGGGPFLDWIVVGGESGPGARPFDVAWARSIIAQCKSAGVACFMKQLGKCPQENEKRLVLMDRKGGDPAEWPEDLRVREFPEQKK